MIVLVGMGVKSRSVILDRRILVHLQVIRAEII